MNINRLIRWAAKDQPRWRNNLPIVFIKGNSPPTVKGRGYYWTNKRGDRILFPNAYAKAWGKPIYHRSTLRIEVGKNFVYTR